MMDWRVSSELAIGEIFFSELQIVKQISWIMEN